MRPRRTVPPWAHDMKGYWRSDVGGEEANRGTLDLYRPETLGDGNVE
ncbi:hypothetical protein LX16_1854 [Stackebrandtia albiflava]|uniref:Uncharacterized protein n=1 Tax=Stackebrandtia albiflava TaxID=406432 RepID=A0A562VE23_9ACTN|nr:hypothetical protein LX16_1854 [Stackebrandtia albiflava]